MAPLNRRASFLLRQVRHQIQILQPTKKLTKKNPGTSAPSTPVKSTPPGTPSGARTPRGTLLTPTPVIGSPSSTTKQVRLVKLGRGLGNISLADKKIHVEGHVIAIWTSEYPAKNGGKTFWTSIQLGDNNEYIVIKIQGSVDGISAGDQVRIPGVVLASVAAQAKQMRNNDPINNPFPEAYYRDVNLTGTKYADGKVSVEKLADGNGTTPYVTAFVANRSSKGATFCLEALIVGVEEQKPDQDYAQCWLTCEDPTSKEQFKLLFPCAWVETARTMEVGGHLTLVNAYVRSRNDQHQNIISVRIGVPNRLDSAVYYEPPSEASENAANAPAVKKMKTDPALSDGGACDDADVF